MDHVEGRVAFGDTKASLLLTADSILLAAMSAVVTGERPLIDRLSTMSRTLLPMAFLALIVALLFALNTILPHRRNLWPTKKQEPTALPVSFGWIAGQKRDAYVEYALSTKIRDLNVSLVRIIHAKSVGRDESFEVVLRYHRDIYRRGLGGNRHPGPAEEHRSLMNRLIEGVVIRAP
jgi:hypothetical protein